MRNKLSRIQSLLAGLPVRSVFDASRLRRGFTLIELLVVIAIISAVTIATVPMILPALDVRRIREAARIVSTHFASAQSEAIAKGRPVGVWIERLGGEKTAAIDLFTCEVPPPYAGDATNSVLTVKVDTSGGATDGIGTVVFAATETPAVRDDFLKPGDLIRFGYRGPYFRFASDAETVVTNATNQVVTTQNVKYLAKANNTRVSPLAGYAFLPVAQSDYQTLPPPPTPPPTKPIYRGLPAAAYSAAGWQAPYQILRQPVKSAGSPVQLPGAAVLDLYYSGTGSVRLQDLLPMSPTNLQTQFPTDDRAILITFNSSGALDSLYLMGQVYKLTEPIHFLVGKRSKLPPQTFNVSDDEQTQADKHNFRDLENIWISTSPQTGLVTTAEVAPASGSSMSQQVSESRAFATSAQTMGGR